jgi:signal transduction histidine kinase
MPKLIKIKKDTMFHLQKRYSLSRDYFIFAGIIISVVLILSIVIGVAIYNSHIQYQQRVLVIESERIERMITEDFDYTNRISVYMGKQIAENGGNDLEFIYHLFQKTSGTQYKTRKLFSWSLFDWVDKNNLQLINSQNGISKIPPDMSHRDYTKKCRETPWTLQVSKPAIGNPSGKWVIPAATGIADNNGNYLGSIVVGFNIKEFIEKIAQLVSVNHVSYVILDKDLNIVMQSVDNKTDFQSNFYKNTFNSSDLFNENSGEIKSIISSDILYTHYRKIDGFPYIIITGFNKYYLNKIFYSTLLPRVLELFGMGAFFLVLLFVFRIYIVSPITKLSNAADKIARGELVKRVPRTPTYETTNLAKQLIYLQSYVKRIQRIDKKLFKAKKDAEDANKAKSDFLANMSHELRTPLNAIIGYSEIIKSELFGPVENKKYTEYANDIYTSGNHLLSLISDILDISKAESGKFEIQEEVIHLNETIAESIKLLSDTASRKGLNFQTNLSEHGFIMLADKLRIKQIMINLLSNAVKFSNKDDQICISLYENNGIYLTVEDNGIGIATKDIPKILEKFGHIKSSMSRQSEGTGLGLWLTKMLVDAHNGTIEIDSELGRGTKVTLFFPKKRLISTNPMQEIA